MAGNQQSESGIDWELERELAAKGYGFDDTDASVLATDFLDQLDAFHLTDDTPVETTQTRGHSEKIWKSAQGTKPAGDRGLKELYRGRGMQRESRDLSLTELGRRGYSIKDTDLADSIGTDLRQSSYGSQSEVAHGRDPRSPGGILQSNLLPGTPSTRVWPEAQPVFMNRTPKRPLNSRDTVEDAVPYIGTPRPSVGAKHRNVNTNDGPPPPSPQQFTWQDTEEYRVAKEKHGEIGASKMFPPKPPSNSMFPPKPPSNIKKVLPKSPSNIKREEIVEIVRPQVWKSSPVVPMTDHRCRDPVRLPIAPSPTARGLPAARKDSVTIEEKRRAASRSLPEEPPVGEDAITIAIKFPSGKRVNRRFLKTDSLTNLKNFIWSQKDAPNSFEVYSNCPRRILECSPSRTKPFVDTFENAGISTNEMLHVEAVR